MVRFILPVKGRGLRKTRLGVSDGIRDDITVAMLMDCLLAVRATELGPVVVVSPDEEVLRIAVEAGALGLVHTGGLNDAIVAAAGAGRCAALLPDVPAVRPQQLVEVLSTFDSGFVPDAAGTGTTLLFGPHLHPHFGPGSAAAHTAAGYPRVDLPECGLTVDVDTRADLLRAESLGLGPHTTQVLARSGADPAVRIGP